MSRLEKLHIRLMNISGKTYKDGNRLIGYNKINQIVNNYSYTTGDYYVKIKLQQIEAHGRRICERTRGYGIHKQIDPDVISSILIHKIFYC